MNHLYKRKSAWPEILLWGTITLLVFVSFLASALG